MFLAMKLHTSVIYVSSHTEGLFKSSKRSIRVRKIALHDENVAFWCATARGGPSWRRRC